MRFSRLRLLNWRNFREVDLLLARRVFIVGPNASGKSNLLDAFRFLRDIADPEGGFQRAVQDRDGVSQIRCLHARRPPHVAVEVEIYIDPDRWTYRLEFGQETRGKRRPLVRRERVTKNDRVLLDRPDEQDDADDNRLTQTHLEQVTANREFRAIAEALAEIRYLHVIPQLVRHPRASNGGRDPFGSDFLEQLATTPKKTQEARLRKINQALKVAVPQLQELKLDRDDLGVPHLKGLYEHWRPNAGWQSEEHFSDGTLRLLGLLWALLDGDAPLLLEEPELSLHAAIVRYIPSMMARAGGKRQRQVLISTHSYELLTDQGIAPEELVLLRPTRDGTVVELAAGNAEIRTLLESGETAAAVAMARTAPEAAAQGFPFGCARRGAGGSGGSRPTEARTRGPGAAVQATHGSGRHGSARGLGGSGRSPVHSSPDRVRRRAVGAPPCRGTIPQPRSLSRGPPRVARAGLRLSTIRAGREFRGPPVHWGIADDRGEKRDGRRPRAAIQISNVSAETSPGRPSRGKARRGRRESRRDLWRRRSARHRPTRQRRFRGNVSTAKEGPIRWKSKQDYRIIEHKPQPTGPPGPATNESGPGRCANTRRGLADQRRRRSMADRAKSTRTPSTRTPSPRTVPPVTQSAFRETFLLHFRPAGRAALAHVGELLGDLILDAPLFMAEPSESEPLPTLRAVAADLEHAAGVLAASAELTLPSDPKLAARGRQWSQQTARLSERIRDHRPGEPPKEW